MRRALAAFALGLACSACARPAPAPRAAAPQRFGAASPDGRSGLLGADPNTTVLAMDAGVAGDRISGLLEVPLEECAVLIARAGPSVEDVDLLVYGEDGSVVGSDEGPDKTPALLVCPPHPRRLWVAARIASGHGLVAIGAQRVPAAEAGRAAKLYGLEPSDEESAARAGAWPGLEERIAAHRRDLGGSWQDVRRAAVPLDARLATRISVQVDAARCLDAFLMPSDEVGHLELTALDANGGIVGRAANTGRERFLVICAPIDTPVTLELRPQSGRGLGVLMLSRTRVGTEADIDAQVTRFDAFPNTELGVAMRERQAALGAKGSTAAKSTATGALEVGRRISVPLALAAGCSRVDVVAGLPLRGVEAWVWSAQGALVAHAESSGHATLFACGAAGAARLDLEATLRSGPFAVLVHHEPDTHPALAASPLAAGRLLAQVVERGLVRRARDIGQVIEAPLSETQQKTLDLTVPFGRCMDVSVALGPDALGVEVRLIAESNGAEVGYARGPHATSARVCSLDAASAQTNLKTRAELRVLEGAGKALIATRMLSPTR